MGEFAIKVSPFCGEYSEGALRGKDTSCGWGWCEPILVGGLTYIGRYYLPKEGVGVQVAEAGASLCGRTCAFSRHCFW